jgi:Carbohydrate binding module (family 6)
VFPATPNWSTWSTVTRTATLAAGTHALKVWFDSATGSAQFMNLDNLTVTPSIPPPPGLVVAVGYADSASGLTPWSGSAHTVFIGEPPQCCATHGPNNDLPGYDAGAIEVTNNNASSVTVDAVTMDFAGASYPPHFDLWAGSTSPRLPQTLTPGTSLVMTMTSAFNFDTSDLFGEACHINTGVVPVVHVTVNGTETDYRDDHQILNSDGADLASCPRDVSEQHAFTPIRAGDQPAAAPINDLPPAVTVAGAVGLASSPAPGRVVSGLAGAWNASPPPTLSPGWLRCDTNGNSCQTIAGARTLTYLPTPVDVGHTLRLRVVATNASGSIGIASPPTALVRSGPAVAQLGDTGTGFTSAYIYQGDSLTWIETAAKAGTTNDFAFFARGAGNDQTFTPRIFSVVNGAKGSLLATGASVKVPRGANGQWYVSALAGLKLSAGARYWFSLDPSSGTSTYVGTEGSGQPSFFTDFAPG